MKTIKYLPLLIIVMIVALMLAGCDLKYSIKGSPDPYPHASKLSTKAVSELTLVVYKDPETGCEYLRARAVEGIVPRMKADGTQVCR